MVMISFQQKIATTLQILLGGQVVAAGIATYIGNDKWFKDGLMPGTVDPFCFEENEKSVFTIYNIGKIEVTIASIKHHTWLTQYPSTQKVLYHNQVATTG